MYTWRVRLRIMRAALSSVKSRIRKGIKYHESRRREQCKAIGTYNRYKLYVYIGVYIYIYIKGIN